MFVFMFRYLPQNVAKMTESTQFRHCLPWKHFMRYASTCLQGFYMKWIYFITSYDPSFILQYLAVVLGTSRSQQIVGHFRRGHRQQALLQGQSLSHLYPLTRDQKGNRVGKKRTKENPGIIWDRNSFQVCLPAYLLFLQQPVVSSSGTCALLWCPIFKLISKASHPLVQATNAIIQTSLSKQEKYFDFFPLFFFFWVVCWNLFILHTLAYLPLLRFQKAKTCFFFIFFYF